jgi:GT2 family glycosyltransferase
MGFAIVVARDGLWMTKACVKSLLAQTVPMKVLVVDNATSDGTGNWLRHMAALNPNLLTMSFKDQEPLAYCWNRALEYAFQAEGEVLVVNNDTELLPETFEFLSTWGKYWFTTARTVRDREDLVKRKSLDNDRHPDFSCFLICKYVFESVGPFDENFKGAYAEDCDYHVRMHLAGIDAGSMDYPFLHHGSGTQKWATPDEAERIRVQANLNRHYFYSKWGLIPGSPEYNAFFETRMFS